MVALPPLGKLEHEIVLGSSALNVMVLLFATSQLWQTSGVLEILASALVALPVHALLHLGWAWRPNFLAAEVLLCAGLAIPFGVALFALAAAGASLAVLLDPSLAPLLQSGGGAQRLRVVALPVAAGGSAQLVCTLAVLGVRARRSAPADGDEGGNDAPTASPPRA